MKPMLTREAAEVLGLIPRTVREHVAKGTLKGRKVGRDIQIDAKSVEVYRQRREEYFRRGKKKRGPQRQSVGQAVRTDGG